MLFVRFVRVVSVPVALVSCLLFGVAPAYAATPVPPPGNFAVAGPATFEGKPIDLRSGWGLAQSCVVLSDHTECFRTNQQANSMIARKFPESRAMQTQVAADAPFDCAWAWLCLYGNTGGQGRRLLFSDERWHHLADWGFADQTKSYRNNQPCYDDAFLGDGVGGALTVDVCSRASSLGSYWSYAVVDVFG